MPGQERVYTQDGQQRDICRDLDMMPEYKFRPIRLWAGDSFRSAVRQKEECDFGVYSISRHTPLPQDIETEDCISRFEARHSKFTKIATFAKGDTPKNLFQCEFRLRMAYLGYSGALSMPAARLFTTSDAPVQEYGVPIPDAYEKVMPRPFVHLQWACSSREGLLFQPVSGQTRAEVDAAFLRAGCRTD